MDFEKKRMRVNVSYTVFSLWRRWSRHCVGLHVRLVSSGPHWLLIRETSERHSDTLTLFFSWSFVNEKKKEEILYSTCFTNAARCHLFFPNTCVTLTKNVNTEPLNHKYWMWDVSRLKLWAFTATRCDEASALLSKRAKLSVCCCRCSTFIVPQSEPSRVNGSNEVRERWTPYLELWVGGVWRSGGREFALAHLWSRAAALDLGLEGGNYLSVFYSY